MEFKTLHGYERPGEPVTLFVPHEGRKLQFASSPIVGCYVTIAERMDSPAARMYKPKFYHLVSLVHEAIQDPKEKHSAEIIRALQHPEDWLISFTGFSYVPKSGGIIRHHPEIRNMHLHLPYEEFADKIQEDPLLRLAVYYQDYLRQENVNPLENSFFKMAGSQETQEKLAAIAKYFGSCSIVGLASPDERKSGYISMKVQSSARGSKFVIDVFSDEQNRSGFSFPIKV